MKFAITITAIMIILVFPIRNLSGTLAGREWITPAYPAQPSEEHTVTLKYSYTYEERQFTPSHSIESLPRDEWTFTTPESAMIARGSAMKQLDYTGWLTTWDELSKVEMEQRAKEHNQKLSDLVDQWRGILGAGRMTMVRRIQTGQYVIVTYRVVDNAGRDIGQLELPSAFHLVEGRWLGTQELSDDILLLESPWIAGKQRVERTIQ